MAVNHGFLRELQRRRVLRTAGIYLIGAWGLLQVMDLAFESFGIAETALRYVWMAAIAGFPVALVFGWLYDITPNGIRRTLPASGSEDLSLRVADYIIVATLAAIAVLLGAGATREIQLDAPGFSGPWYAGKSLGPAIAVLPLEKLSGQESQDYLSEGLHDTLINALSRITQLKVTSRYSTRRLGAGLALRDIGERLGVDTVLSGSVLREGTQVRVNVTLVDIEAEETLWTDSFTREFDGLISMQNEIASAVAREVKVQLGPEEQRRLVGAESNESATYEAYLRGMSQLQKGGRRSTRRAIEIFTEAAEDNPTSALAYAGLAIGYSQLGHSPFPVAGAYPRAKEAADKALAIDPDLAEAHLAVAMYKIYYEWDFSGSEAHFQRALELNPSLVEAHYHYAWLLELHGRDEEAIRFGENASRLNPLSPFFSAWLAEQYRDAGMFDRAIEEAETTLALNPGYGVALMSLGQSFLDQGMYDQAVEIHERLRDNPGWSFVLAATLATTGRDAEADELFQTIREQGEDPFSMSLIYGARGDVDKTVEWLTKAREEKVPWYPWLANWFPQTAATRDEPGMQKLIIELAVEAAE